MPKIYKDGKGNTIKEGPNGCEDCGFNHDNTVVVSSGDSDTKDTAKSKGKPTEKSSKAEGVETDGD